MNLLGAAHYDPATAVSKATTAALAMTALDTTNLRLTVTVPPSGMLLWEIDGGAIHGAVTMPQIFLGVMEGLTVRGRKAVEQDVSNLAATSLVFCRAKGVITGLTPGASIRLDAAYGVETVVASTGYKYGGPNDATANNAFGAVTFTVWDPAPKLAYADQVWDVAMSGHVAAGSTGEKQNNLDATVSSRLASANYTAPDNTRPANFTALAITAGGAVTAGTVSDKTGYSLSGAGIQAIWDALTSALTTVGSIGKRLVDNIDALISSRLATAGYTAPDNAGITAIKAKTDSLFFSVAGHLDVNVLKVNGVTMTGTGTLVDPWRAV